MGYWKDFVEAGQGLDSYEGHRSWRQELLWGLFWLAIIVLGVLLYGALDTLGY